MVAALLIDDGFDGDALVGLAALTSHADGWDVEPLVPDALRELGAPRVDVEEAGAILARTLAAALPRGDHMVIRYLARLAPDFDYPGGAIGTAHYLEEWLDCECHEGSLERAEADEFEASLLRDPLYVRPELASAMFDA